MHRRREVWSIVALSLVLAAVPVVTWAEDGYDLWLRYAPIEDARLRDAYRRAIAGVVVQQSPATAAIVSNELTRGLKGLFGDEVPAWTSVTRDGALVVGTLSSPIVAALGWRAELERLGPEGFVIRPARVGGRRALVVASAGDSGALYGAFHLLRLLATGAPVARLDVREKPRHQLRLLNHWDNLDGIDRARLRRAARCGTGTSCRRRIDPRLHDYARANASLGINGTVLNNVNANARSLTAEYLGKAAAIADVLPPLRHPGLPLRQLRRAPHDRRTADRRSARPGGAAVVEGQGDRDLQGDSRLRRLPGQGQQRGAAGAAGLQAHARRRRQHARRRGRAARRHRDVARIRLRRERRSRPRQARLHGVRAARRDVPRQRPRAGQERPARLHAARAVPPAVRRDAEDAEHRRAADHAGVPRPLHASRLPRADVEGVLRQPTRSSKGPGSTVAKVADGTLQGHARTGIAGVANTGSDRNWTGHHFAAGELVRLRPPGVGLRR